MLTDRIADPPASMFAPQNEQHMETQMKNRVQLVGNLGRDPELKEFEGGRRRLRFSIATNERFTFGQGQIKDDTQWHQVVAWGKLAEDAAQALKKGASVSIEGRLVHRNYEDKDGQKRYVTEVVMSRFELVDLQRTAAAA